MSADQSSSPPKRTFWWLLAAVVAIAAAFWYRTDVLSPPAPQPVAVTLITGGSGPYWQLVGNGATAAAEQYDVDLKILQPTDDENIAEQTALLKKVDPKQVDGLAISPLDAAGQASLINEVARDCPVITYDSDAPDSMRLSYVGTSNLQAGERAAHLVEDALPEGGQVAVVLANLSKANMIERRDGFNQHFERRAAVAGDDAPKYEVVDHLVDEGSAETCRELVLATIEEHPDLACLVGMNAQHGAMLTTILKDAGKLGEIKIVAFDEDEATLDGIERGDIYGTIVQDPYRYGHEAVRQLASLARGAEVVRPLRGSFSTIGVATLPITKDDLEAFRAELAARLDGKAPPAKSSEG
ncbi:MAG: hypothetical protein CMJ58_09935 [Planctomycetaceae bacterium]|nr:hypothetical protein [Planctomycetaceae bacterium]